MDRNDSTSDPSNRFPATTVIAPQNMLTPSPEGAVVFDEEVMGVAKGCALSKQQKQRGSKENGNRVFADDLGDTQEKLKDMLFVIEEIREPFIDEDSVHGI